MPTPLVTLAFDTSTSKGGVAVLQADKILSRIVWDRDVSHGELLTPALQRAVATAGLEMKEIRRLAVGHGPGSFTGVRIAVNAARALAYALQLPVYLFDTSEILANGVTRSDLPILVMINAHKNLVFASTFGQEEGHWKRKTPLAAYDLKTVENFITQKHLCVGDGYEEFQSAMTASLRSNLVRDPAQADDPRPEVLGRMAQDERLQRPPFVWKDVQALYIRASGAEEKLQESRDRKT